MGTIIRLRSKENDSQGRNIVIGVNEQNEVVTVPFYDTTDTEDPKVLFSQLWDWSDLGNGNCIFKNLQTGQYLSHKNGTNKPVVLVDGYDFTKPDDGVTWFMAQGDFNNNTEKANKAPRAFFIATTEKSKVYLSTQYCDDIAGVQLITKKGKEDNDDCHDDHDKDDHKDKDDKNKKFVASWYIDPPRMQVNNIAGGKVTIRTTNLSDDSDVVQIWTNISGGANNKPIKVTDTPVVLTGLSTFFISCRREQGGVVTDNSINTLEDFQSHLVKTGDSVTLNFFYGDPDPAKTVEVDVE